jgi:hypothetical protein
MVLTPEQIHLLRNISQNGGVVASRNLSASLYNSTLNQKPDGGQRWTSRWQCGGVWVKGLVKLGLIERRSGGLTALTEEGRKWLDEAKL